MKKTLITVLITLAAVALVLLAINAFWCQNECTVSDAGDDKGCCPQEAKQEQCDKKDKTSHHTMMMDKLRPMRAAFDEALSADEKSTIADIRDKFEGADPAEMCPEGKKIFMEEHESDLASLQQIADNHTTYLDSLYQAMHKEMGEDCDHHKSKMKDEECEGEAHHGDMDHEEEMEKVKAHDGCPEVHECMDATEKCKGEKEAKKKEECEEEVEKKCEKATEECMKECMGTFKTQFLLLEG